MLKPQAAIIATVSHRQRLGKAVVGKCMGMIAMFQRRLEKVALNEGCIVLLDAFMTEQRSGVVLVSRAASGVV